MKSKIIFSIILGIFLISFTSAALCYQEFANVSTACGGLSTGTYNFSGGVFSYPDRIIDGNWGSAGYAGDYNEPHQLIINYSKPASATDSSLIQYKSQTTYANFTIGDTSCWDYDINVLEIKINSFANSTSLANNLSCFNGSGWELLYQSGYGATNEGWIYEEAMYWDTSGVTLTSPVYNFNTTAISQIFDANFTFQNRGTPTNATLYIWYSNGTLVSTNFSVVDTTKNSSSLSLTLLGNHTYLWNYKVYYQNSTSTDFAWADSNFTLNKKLIIINSVSYNPNADASSSQSFYLNLSYSSLEYGSILVNLNYNNTNYVASTMDVGSTKIFSSTLVVPYASSSINKTFYWNITLIPSTGTNFNQMTSQYNQTISPLFIDDCKTYTNKVFNISIKDEDSFESLNGTVDLLVKLYSLGTDNLISQYNNSLKIYTNQSTEICLSNFSNNYSIGYTMRYYSNSSNYFIQYKTIQKMNIYSGNEQNIILYNLLSSRGNNFLISLVGVSNTQNMLIDVQRQYLSLNNFLSVDSLVTDSNSQILIPLVQNTEKYNFIISQNGVVIASFNNYQVKCTNIATGDCSVTLNLYQSTAHSNDYSTYGNISQVYLWDNSTRTLYFTFVSTDGNIHTVQQEVFQNHQYTGMTSICQNTILGTSGSFSCNIPENYGNDSLTSNIVVDGILVGSKIITISQPPDFFSGVRNILAIFLYSTLTLLFMSHPIFIVIGSILGIVLSAALLLITGTSSVNVVSVIIFFVAAGVIIAWQIGRRQ